MFFSNADSFKPVKNVYTCIKIHPWLFERSGVPRGCFFPTAVESSQSFIPCSTVSDLRSIQVTTNICRDVTLCHHTSLATVIKWATPSSSLLEHAHLSQLSWPFACSSSSQWSRKKEACVYLCEKWRVGAAGTICDLIHPVWKVFHNSTHLSASPLVIIASRTRLFLRFPGTTPTVRRSQLRVLQGPLTPLRS